MSKAQFLVYLILKKQVPGKLGSTNLNALFPGFQSRTELRRIAWERKQKYLSKRQEEHHRLLLHSQDENHWSTSSGKYRKDRMPGLVTGKVASKRDTDPYRMRKHIENSLMEKAMYPDDKRDGPHFNPIDVPILDILAMEADQEYGWKYPSTETLQTFQAFWGLGDRMLDNCVMKGIILNGDQSEKKQRDIIAWHHETMGRQRLPLQPSQLGC